MAAVLIMFSVSILICCAIAYTLGLLWFSDVRNRRHKSFFYLGIEVFIWTLLNAITMVCSAEYFPVIYTLRMVMVCIIPFGVSWFILEFVDSKLAKIKLVRFLFIVISAADILCMVSNPLHYLYFTDYNIPVPGRAPIFWIHTAAGFLLIIVAFLFLLHYVVGNAKRNPFMILTVVGMMIPYTLNLMYSFNMIPFEHDTTPIGFFFTLMLFIVASYKAQLFNIKTALFASTMDSINDIIILFNEKLVVIDANEHALEFFRHMALSTGRTKFRTLYDQLINAAADDKSVEFINEMRENRDIAGEFTIDMNGTGAKTYSLTWRPVYEKDRKTKTGYMFMMADVSVYHNMINEINDQNRQLTELKEEAESASRAKGEFLSRMSHEMRTPMNAIIGMTQVALKSGDHLDEDVENSLMKIKSASDHLLGVINDVLDMSKIESGKFALSEYEFSLDNMLRSLSAMADIHTDQKKQDFTVEIDENIPEILYADNQRLTQVVTNLLSNAFKFTPVGGRINLIVKLDGHDGDYALLRFEVRDTGIGIAADQIQHLFNPFEQADGSISRNFGGTGLGLAISRNIVEMMGGRIWVESIHGAGSSFIFTVKIKKGNKQPTDEPVTEILTDAGDETDDLSGCNILLVEDVEINREIIIALLSDSGVIFDVAENGKIACDMYVQTPDKYDMIFMDMQMPVMDGLTATTFIRSSKTDTSDTIPIIAMTANVFREDVNACLEVGMNDHIAKPVDINKIKSAIHKYYQAKPKIT